MISFIEGKVCDKNPDYLILAVNGMGLRLNYATQYAHRMPAVGDEARLYTYLHVREDELSLYAFPDYEEKQLFELLLTVSGFGPKIAGTVVASMSPANFALAILNADVKSLTTIKGVGKKSAERLILELKDKLKGVDISLPEGGEELIAVANESPQGEFAEALSALRVLGYSQQEAEAALKKVAATGESLELTELIRLALRELAIV